MHNLAKNLIHLVFTTRTGASLDRVCSRPLCAYASASYGSRSRAMLSTHGDHIHVLLC